MSLPAWLEAALPTPSTPAVLDLEDGKLMLTLPTGEKTEHADLASVAGQYGNYDLKITHAVNALVDEDDRLNADDEDPFFFYPVSKNFSGSLMSYTDAHRRGNLERAYVYARERQDAYFAAPDNFYNAYHFVDSHPVFWTHIDGFDWATEGHCEKVNAYVMKHEGEVVVALETGAHVPNDDVHTNSYAYTTHFHDYRLDVYGATFEEAFGKLAERVAYFFAPDGTELENRPHDKPAWVEKLEERVAEAEASLADETD